MFMGSRDSDSEGAQRSGEPLSSVIRSQHCIRLAGVPKLDSTAVAIAITLFRIPLKFTESRRVVPVSYLPQCRIRIGEEASPDWRIATHNCCLGLEASIGC